MLFKRYTITSTHTKLFLLNNNYYNCYCHSLKVSLKQKVQKVNCLLDDMWKKEQLMTVISYARVIHWTKIELQIEKLNDCGCEEIFIEK